MTQTAMTFEQLMEASVARCNSGVFNGRKLADWNPAEWSNAMAGEVGEACNVTKKMQRGDYGNIVSFDGLPTGGGFEQDLGNEIADVVTYALMLAARCGINPSEAIRDKFNEVSDRVGSPIKL